MSFNDASALTLLSDQILSNIAEIGDRLRVLAIRADHDPDVYRPYRGIIAPAFGRFAIGLAQRRAEIRANGHTEAKTLQMLRSEGWMNTAAEHVIESMGA